MSSLTTLRLDKFKKLKGITPASVVKDDDFETTNPIMFEEGNKKEVFETLSVKDRLNSAMPIRTSKEGFQGTKSVDDVSPESLKKETKAAASKNKDLDMKLKVLRKLRRE